MTHKQEIIAADDTSVLHVRRFERSDWAWVERWFEDSALNSALGPLDLEWVEHVLADNEGVQLVIEQCDGTAVALVGVAWDRTGKAHGITDFAVDPALRRSGIGRGALAAALTWPSHPPTEMWIAFVDPENTVALAFFSSLGWMHDGIDSGMHRFQVPNSPVVREGKTDALSA